MSRFDDPKHLETWRAGCVPAIYQPMVSFALDTYGTGDGWQFPLLDFACGTGILGACIGERILGSDRYPPREAQLVDVWGVDGSERRVQLGADFGIPCLMHMRPIRTPDDVTEYGRWIGHLQVRTVLMRRAIADVFEKQPQLVHQFAAELEQRGVRRLLVEGRVPVRNAVNPFPTIDHEVAALAPHFREVERRGPLSYLEVSPA